MITYLIAPALTDQAGQCRIVARTHGRVLTPDLKNYREDPAAWREAGLMASTGTLRALEAPLGHQDHIRTCEPLAAGLTFTFEE